MIFKATRNYRKSTLARKLAHVVPHVDTTTLPPNISMMVLEGKALCASYRGKTYIVSRPSAEEMDGRGIYSRFMPVRLAHQIEVNLDQNNRLILDWIKEFTKGDWNVEPFERRLVEDSSWVKTTQKLVWSFAVPSEAMHFKLTWG